MTTCDPQFLIQRGASGGCSGNSSTFLALDPTTMEETPWHLCLSHQQQYLLCLRCRNRFVSPYMVRRLCLGCVELMRETGEPEYV